MTDIDEYRQEIESYLKTSGKNIFRHVDSTYSEFISQIEWSEEEHWEEFFSIAEKEGVSTFFEEIEKFDMNYLNDFKNNLNEDSEEHEDLVENICMNLENNLDEIASITFSWFKNNIRHSLTKKVSWIVEVEHDIAELNRNKRKLQKNKIRSRENMQLKMQMDRESDVPENLILEDEGELAKQLLGHSEEQFPNYAYGINYHAEKTFWEPKGIIWHNPKHDIFRNKITSLALKLKDNTEKEKIPDLVEKCIEWAIENKMYKPTQTAIKGFLAEDEEYLSPNNFKILHMKVTMELQSSK